MTPGLIFERELPDFLATWRTASLATVDAAAQPHAANVQYVHDERWRLHWVSAPGSDHSQHLLHNPRAAVTIYAHQDTPELIHGVQMRGVLEAVIAPGQPGWEEAWSRYVAKYSFVAAQPGLREAVERQRFYRFRPTWVRWIDNRRGFGWKVERALPG